MTAALATGMPGAVAGEVVLKASHQWPEKVGDLRHEMMQMIADDVRKAEVDARIDVFAASTKVKPREQYDALIRGEIDLSLYPLDYASDKHPEFSVTLMPALVHDHAHAKRLSASPFMADLKRILARDGLFALADGWLAGGIVSRRGCIVRPADVKGLNIRPAGPMFATLLAGAGASVATVPLSEVPEAMRREQLDAAVTSSESLLSMNLHNHSRCLTAPGGTAIWFMYEPILMAQRAFDQLSQRQQDALLEAARRAQAWGYQRAEDSDEILVEAYTWTGVHVTTMTPAEAAEWRALAETTAYREFALRVQNGQSLLDKALAVP